MNKAKAAWKVYWRLNRIFVRESTKAHIDQLLYGTGVLMVQDSGEALRIAPQDVLINSNGIATLKEN